MNIEDCEVGMKVEPLKEFGEIHKDGLKIHSINPDRKLISIRNGCFISSDHNPEYFEPVNKFEVGDEVIWCREKVKIWGMRYDNEVNKFEYAVEGYGKNNGRTIVFENELSPLKKKDELEVGDKFKAIDSVFEVVAAGEDSVIGTVYFAKSLGMKTMYYKIHWEKVNKIIYN